MVSHIFFIGYGYKNSLVRARSKGNHFHPSSQAEPAVPAAVTSHLPYGHMATRDNLWTGWLQPHLAFALEAALSINC